MKTPNKKYEGKEIKKLVIVPSRMGLRWKITLENGHVIYPIDGWETRKEAYQDFIKAINE